MLITPSGGQTSGGETFTSSEFVKQNLFFKASVIEIQLV